MKIAVDAMGGDNAPKSVVEGILKARDEYNDLEFILFGKLDQIKPLINNDERISFIQANEEIVMNDEPVKAIRHKKESSLVLAAKAVKDGEADALFSCGNTGALLAAGLLIIGRIKGVQRPGLLSTLPVVASNQGGFNLLDSGANADNKPEYLYQFALMGKYYAESVRGIKNPRIGLLNNGTEPHKGSKLTQAAYQMISEDKSLNFVGNVESRDLTTGICDVVVADGFTGNAVLKAIEGTASSVMHLVKDSVKDANIFGKLGALMLKPSLMKIKERMNPSRYGGAVLLGVKAPVVKAHGSSDAQAVFYTVKQIRDILNGDLLTKFSDTFKKEQTESKDI
nr:phosphate acyltransferase PlsX [uncultured Ligilactobacillus sp.]